MDEQGKCPICGAEAILVYEKIEGRLYLHEVWRHCSCPMPRRVSEYLLAQ